MLISQFFEVLADPTRQLLVESLRSGELSVSELVSRVSIQQSGVSRHLRLLTEAGFVRVRAKGTKRLYSLRPEPFVELSKWTQQFRSLFEKRFDRLGSARNQKQGRHASVSPSQRHVAPKPRQKKPH